MRRAVQWGILLVLCGFFLTAGLLKIADPAEFALSILRYRLVGERLAWIAALWLPWLEVFSALALLWRPWRRAGGWILFGLLCVFEISLASAVWRQLDITCGCLGAWDRTPVGFALVRNLVLMGGLLLLDRLERPAR